jgi:hypothetical protein
MKLSIVVPAFNEEAYLGPTLDRFRPQWRALVWTTPPFIALFRCWRAPWGGWYSDAVR